MIFILTLYTSFEFIHLERTRIGIYFDTIEYTEVEIQKFVIKDDASSLYEALVWDGILI